MSQGKYQRIVAIIMLQETSIKKSFTNNNVIDKLNTKKFKKMTITVMFDMMSARKK
jgi:hypothetical protein